MTENEDINESITKKLTSYFGYTPYYKQVKTFGDPKRHPEGHVITICIYVLLPTEKIKKLPFEHKWVDVKNVPKLAFDHNELIKNSVLKVEKNIKRSPIAFELLPKNFKLSTLFELYSTLLNKAIDKRNFIRKLKLMNIVEKSGKAEKSVKHRPAELYVFNNALYEKFVADDGDFKLP